MAKLYLDADDKPVAFDPDTNVGPPLSPPAGYSHLREFDPASNRMLMAAIEHRADGLRVDKAGNATLDGSPLRIEDDTPATVERRQRATLLAKLDADQPLTPAELRAALRYLLRR